MTKDEAVEALKALDTWDRESVHCEADDILLKFLEANGFGDVAEAWNAADERCGGFWYA
jgi:hypothetical protein